MKKTFMVKLIITTLVASLSILSVSFSSFADTAYEVSNEMEIAPRDKIMPRVLLTLSGTQWDSKAKINFYYKYVVDDAHSKIIKVEEAYVTGVDFSVDTFGKVNVYIPSSGSSAMLTCSYTNRDSTTGTAVLTLYP